MTQPSRWHYAEVVLAAQAAMNAEPEAFRQREQWRFNAILALVEAP